VNKTLTSIDLSGTKKKSRHHELTRSKLLGNELAEADVHAICDVLKVNKTLTSINLSSMSHIVIVVRPPVAQRPVTIACVLSTDDAKSIAQALQVNKTLTHIDLSGTFVSFKKVDG
jgi:Ran GTPase-activating protein (RanGAP) involved in mRNA processing and transport